MSKEVHEWSIDVLNNVFAPADGGCAEGWTGKDVNNAARERMRAFAAWYRAQEFAKTLFNEAPYGAKAFVRISNTVFRVTTIDCTSTFPIGRRIRVYDNVGGSIDAFVANVAFVGGGPYTEVTCSGGPNLPGTITDVGVTTNLSLLPFAYGGMGTTAARDARFATVPPDGVMWLNTTTNTMQISNGGAWRSLISIDPAVTNWHSANDGAGSGLDADLLDGVQLADIYSRHEFKETSENVQANIPGATTTAAVTAPAAGTNKVKVNGILQLKLFWTGAAPNDSYVDITLERKVNAGAFAAFKTFRAQIDNSGGGAVSLTWGQHVAWPIKTAFTATNGDSYQFRLAPVVNGTLTPLYVADNALGGHVNNGLHFLEAEIVRTA